MCSSYRIVTVTTIVGNNVTVGHKSLIHGCKIGDNTLIGMGSIVLDGAEIGEYTLLGAGSLVPPGKENTIRSISYGFTC